MLRMILAIVLIWLMFTFTTEILGWIHALLAWVMSHVHVTVSW